MPVLELLDDEVRLAVSHLLRVARDADDAERVRLGESSGLRRVETHWNPTYVSIAEFCFQWLADFLITVDRHSQGKKRAANWNTNRKAQELLSLLPDVAASYEPGIRNAIAHGQVRYTDHEITYEAHNPGPQRVFPGNLERVVDRLFDTCTSVLVAALLATAREGMSLPPCMLEILLGGILAPGWEIRGCTFTPDASPTRRVDVSIEAPVKSGKSHLYEGRALAAACKATFGSRIDSARLSFECGGRVPTTLSVRLAKLDIESADSLNATYAESIASTPLFWFGVRNREWHVGNLQASAENLREDLRSLGDDFLQTVAPRRLFEIRHVENRSGSGVWKVIVHALARTELNDAKQVIDMLSSVVTKVRKQRYPLFRLDGRPRSTSTTYAHLGASSSRGCTRADVGQEELRT